MPDASSLQQALAHVSARAAQVLLARCAPGADHHAFAARYGLAEAPAEALLYRSALALRAALDGAAAPRPAPSAEEAKAAHALRLALEEPAPAQADADAARLAQPLRDLTAHHAAVVAAIARAEAEHEASPEFRRLQWLRRLAIAVIVLLSVYFYWREHAQPAKPPAEPRPLFRR